MTKPKRNRYFTPVCVALWPWLIVPDTKFKPEGEYKVSLVMEPNSVALLQAAVAAEVQEAEKALKSANPKIAKYKLVWPIKDQVDEADEPTGNKLVAFSQVAKVERPGQKTLTFDVAVFDAKKKPFPKNLKMGSGSEVKLCFNVRVVEDKLNKCIRVKLQILAAQVLKFVEYTGGDFGFSEEAGYEAPAEVESTEPAAGAAPAAGTDNPDF